MWFSVQQVLAGPSGAPGTPKATFEVAISDLEPLHLAPALGHPGDQARLQTELQKLQAQVSSPCCPPPAVEHGSPNTPQAHQGSAMIQSLSSLPHSADTGSLPQPTRLTTLLLFPQKGPREASQGGTLEPQ